jgi:uncharacterized membrane protein
MKRPLTILALLAPAVLVLAACQPKAPKPAAAAPEAEAPASDAPATRISDFSQPMTARGTEPFWALTLDGTHLKLTRPDKPDLVAEAPGAAISPGRAVWIARSTDGQQMTVTFYVGHCSDGMSEQPYPMSAEVAVLNDTLHGCAAKTAELPRQGG